MLSLPAVQTAMKMDKLKYTLITFILLPFLSEAQEKLSVKELFTDKLHPAVIANAAGSDAYNILSAIRLNVPNSLELIEEFREGNPESPLITQMYFYHAVNMFDSEKYNSAAAMFEKIGNRELYREQQDEFNFRKGYCYMRTGNIAEALRCFNRVLNDNNSQFVYPALYYCGYLNYIDRNFKEAIPYFERAKRDSRYALLSKYHIVESRFMLKDYGYVIENGPEVYESIENDYKANVARIMSEAYYALHRPEEAKYYFELYSLAGGNMSEKDIFYSGMIHYSLNNHISAKDAFSQIASSADSLGQSAAYHLGQCYIQLKNKHKAQEAFKTAATSDFDPAIKEDAYFNYAKLTFDLYRDVAPFNEYLSKFSGTTVKSDELHNYMATSFLMNGNYDDAITALNSINNRTDAVVMNLQKAAFFRGIQLVKSGAYSKAAEYFSNSLRNGNYNSNLKNLASFWLAECYYRSDRFSKSLEILRQLGKNSQFRSSAEYPLSKFNIAYSLFKMEQYREAISEFENYISMPGSDRELATESKIRIADSYYMLRDYAKSAEIYEQATADEGFNTLYPGIQGALCYGLTGNYEKKTSLLQEIVKPENEKSPLYNQALYELGRTYIRNVEDEKAEPLFKKLLTAHSDSSYYYKSLLELGMIKANRKEYDGAIEYYKRIVTEKPVSDEAQSALAGIENIYQIQNKPDEFLKYLDSMGLSETKTEGERETMLFNSAEQIYLSNNHKEALDALLSFVKRYPDGIKSPYAYFYIAECYSALSKPEKAADYYHKVMETGDSSFAELATLKYGEFSYKLERFHEAAMVYETLGNIAVIENNKVEAVMGKMKSYFGCKEYDNSLDNAYTLLKMTNIPSEYTMLAKYYAAKDNLALGNREKASIFLRELAADPSKEEGSEAAYLLILDAYDTGNFTEVEEMTFKLSEGGKAAQYWLAKSFIVLGDSYAERDNYAQAEATFNSILDNYKSQHSDEIKALVKSRIEKLSTIKNEKK